MQSKTNDLTKQKKKKINFNSYMVYVIFGIVLVLFAIWLGSNFFSASNLLNVTRQTAMVSVMAIATTFVIASGQIDLSVGSIVAITSLVVALILQQTNNIPLALVAGLGLGAGIGAANGFFITKLRIPAFLATLGTQTAIKGFAMWTTETKAVPIMNDTFNEVFGQGSVGPIPVLLLWTIVVVIIGFFAMNHLPYGRRVLAIGGNATSARFSGINVNKTLMVVMIVNGIAASFAGILYSGRSMTARYTFGEGDELSAIAAVVLGGTSMSGGNGNIIGALVGSLLLGMINNGLVIGGLTVSQQMIVRGAIIVIAVALSNIGDQKRARS